MRFDPIIWAADSSEQTPEGLMTGYIKQLEKWLCSTKHQAAVSSCYLLENETNYSDMLIMITPEIVLISWSSESFNVYPMLFVPSISHPTSNHNLFFQQLNLSQKKSKMARQQKFPQMAPELNTGSESCCIKSYLSILRTVLYCPFE